MTGGNLYYCTTSPFYDNKAIENKMTHGLHILWVSWLEQMYHMAIKSGQVYCHGNVSPTLFQYINVLPLYLTSINQTTPLTICTPRASFLANSAILLGMFIVV